MHYSVRLRPVLVSMATHLGGPLIWSEQIVLIIRNACLVTKMVLDQTPPSRYSVLASLSTAARLGGKPLSSELIILGNCNIYN